MHIRMDCFGRGHALARTPQWRRAALCMWALVGASSCATGHLARKDDVEALRKDMRDAKERQVLMERRLADMDTRLALMADRMSARPAAERPTPPSTTTDRTTMAQSGRPALGVVRVAPTGRRPAAPPPQAAQPTAASPEDAVMEIDGQPVDLSGADDANPTLAVDRAVLARPDAARPEALAAEEEEVLARTDPKTQYNLAMRQFKANAYAEAARGFEEVADRWPEHPLADNAVYWTGVCYLQQGEMALAINELQKVPVRFPKSDKVPDALFQLAEAYQRVGDTESAKAMLTQVVQLYPAAEAARPARETLGRLNAR